MGHANGLSRPRAPGKRSANTATRSGTKYSDRLLVSRKDSRAVSGLARFGDENARGLQRRPEPRGRMEPSRSARQHANGRTVHQPDRYSFHPRLRGLDHAALPAGEEFTQMTTIYSARWVLPVATAAIENGAVAVEGQRIAGVGPT